MVHLHQVGSIAPSRGIGLNERTDQFYYGHRTPPSLSEPRSHPIFRVSLWAADSLRLIPHESRRASGALMGVGPGLYVLPRIHLLRLSEKSQRGPQLSLRGNRNNAFRTILASVYRPIPRSERR